MDNIFVKSFLIDFYLNKVNKRINLNEKPLIIDYLLFYNYIIGIIKFICILYLKPNYETRLHLYDFTLFFGGIQEYNIYSTIFLLTFGLIMYQMIHLNTSKATMEWIELPELIAGYNRNELDKYRFKHYISKMKNFKLYVKYAYRLSCMTYLIFGMFNHNLY